MLTKKVEKALNEQVTKEFYSANLYLSMATWADNNGLPGTAQWLYSQTEEERMHGMKILHFIIERGGRATVDALAKPEEDFKDVQTVFEKALAHEKFVSDSIDKLALLAWAEKDLATYNMLQWFISEQVEEEATASAIIDKIKLAGKNNLYEFDKEIGNLRAAEAAAEAE